MLTDQPTATSETTNGTAVLKAEAISKSYGTRTVLSDVSLSIEPAERVALTGPSGSGKTTLLNCLGGIDRPDRGVIELHGENLTNCSPETLASLRRRRIGTVFQFFHLLPTLSALENVEFPLQLLGVNHRDRLERVREMLERVNVADRAESLPSQMSGGEMQRVAIARALVHEPDLVLADEPTGNLDSVNGRRILDLLEELTAATKTALVLVTHSDEAAAICHRNVRLRDGRIV